MSSRAADASRREVIIERRSVSAPFDSIVRNLNPLALARNLWTHRDLVRQFTAREIAGRYKGSFFGLFWSLSLNASWICLVHEDQKGLCGCHLACQTQRALKGRGKSAGGERSAAPGI